MLGEAVIYGFSMVSYCFFSLLAAIGTAFFFQDANADQVLVYGIATSIFMAIGTALAFFVTGIF